MALRGLHTLIGSASKERVKSRKQQQRVRNRRVLSERLEDRRMLAGPELIAIRPDAGALLRDGDTLSIAPREFNLLFKGGADLQQTTINANSVRLIRSGGDGVFGDANDVAVSLGYVGLVEPGDVDAANLQQIVMRPASSAAFNATSATNQFPDDTYQIQIRGTGATPLTNRSGQAFNSGVDVTLNFRLDRGAQVVAVSPQPISRTTQRINIPGSVSGGTYRLSFQGQQTTALAFDATNATIEAALLALPGGVVKPGDVQVTGTREVTFTGQYAGEHVALMTVSSSLTGGVATVSRTSALTQSSNQIVVYFDNQRLNDAEVLDPKFYRLVNTSATVATNDDRTLLPQSVSYDPTDDSAVLTFAQAIPEGNYRLDIGESGGVDSTLLSAVNVGSLFTNNGFTRNGFLGDENGVSNAASDVDLYRVNLLAGASFTATLTPHAATMNLRLRILDAAGAQIASVNLGAGGSPSVTLPIATSGNHFLEVSSADGTTGSYLISASVTASAISASDNNSTITTATNLGSLGAAGVLVTSQIQSQSIPLPPRPGSEDEPGHRQIQREQHIAAVGTTPVVPAGTRVVRYYFPDTLGTRDGVTYLNLITATEKQIIREIFEIYAKLSGYEFVESPATTPGGDQLMIGKGDFRAVSPSLGPNDGVAGLANSSFALANGSIYNQPNRFFGDGFTDVMFHEIGHSLGLGHSYDVPSNMGNGVPNDVLPGDHDIVHLQRIVPPNSTDIDMYRFTLSETGTFSAETIAERLLPTPSFLNSVLTLYRELPSGDIEMVARNDQYFGSDSFLELTLEPGNYFIGVTSTGNTQYDPRVPDSGFGGTTNGNYQLRMNFKADRGGSLRDVSGTSVDGDGDGEAGGVHSFWFQASDPATTIYVDKLADTVANVVNGTGSLADPYDTINFALQQAGSRIVVPTNGATSITVGQQFVVNDGANEVTFRFGTTGTDPINLAGATSAADVAARIQTAIIAARTAGRLASTVTVSLTGGGRVVQLGAIDNLDMSGAPTLVSTPNIVRIVGNGGADQNLNTIADNRPYLIGEDTSGNALADGRDFLVPQGVTVMIGAGTLLKMKKTNLDVGSSGDIDRSAGVIQVIGTPKNSVFMRSFHDDTAGGNSDGPVVNVARGDFGGIVFRGDSDLENSGMFLNYVNHVDISHGGGKVFVESQELVYTPIHIIDARPTVSFNRISNSDDAAMSANPNSFDDALNRIGPDIKGNFLVNNTTNGLFVRIDTPLANSVTKLNVSGRFDDTDIAHVLTENLIIEGAAGGLRANTLGQLVARPAGRLMIDPGVVLKMNRARIEAERGAGTIIAEGTVDRPIVFTSTRDDRYGGSGSFDTNSGGTAPAVGNWSGIYFGAATSGSIDHALITFAGGLSPIEGGDANFNAIEIHQADVRIANSVIHENAGGAAGSVRNGRGANQAAAIYVRGAQPILINNEITGNAGAAININANSLKSDNLRDIGRATGAVEDFTLFADNRGPLIRLNRLEENNINGMLVRGEVLTTESVWDDTDMVHVLQSLITVGNHHTFSGLTLQSSNTESLVVKLSGGNAGFTATGTPVEIIDRIGGTIHVLGTVGHPVILTHLNDDTVGAGFTTTGRVNRDTDNVANTTGTSGGWRGFLFDEFSNDRNVAILRELENPLTNRNDVNRTPGGAQLLGTLAPNQKSGDERSRLGFEVQGYISPNDPGDIDVYSFEGTAGTPVWIDIDRTDTTLDAIIEVVNSAGTVLARSMRSGNLTAAGTLNAPTLTQNQLLGGDTYTQNFRDPGLFYVLPTSGIHFIRVRSNPASAANVETLAGESRGQYQLQVRLQQIDEFPGSTIRFSDIRFAQTAIDVRGLPSRSPLIGEAGELPGANNTFATAQALTNLLESDMAALSIAGDLSELSGGDIDWYSFDVAQTGVQVIAGVNDGSGTVAVVFDLDYADGAVRADTTIAVYDSQQNLIYVGRESNVQDDQPLDASGNINDLSRGSLGRKDPYVGPIHLIPGQRYYVAVMSDRQLPSALTGAFLAAPTNAANRLVRVEPINSLARVVEDHIGFSGYNSNGAAIQPTTQSIFNITNPASLAANHIVPYTLQDVGLFIATDRSVANANDQLYMADAFNGGVYTNVVSADGWAPNNDDIQDITIRSDGRMFGYRRIAGSQAGAGELVEINPDANGAFTTVLIDNVPAGADNFNTRNIDINLGSHQTRSDQFTNSDDVDALTFERTGTVTAAPSYNVYYSVRESSGSSKLYRARGTGDATPAAAVGGNPNAAGSQQFGLMGSIQTGANAVFPVTNGVTNASIRVSSLNGAIFNFAITRNASPQPFTAVVNVGARTATINISPTYTPTVGEIINFINAHPQMSTFLVAGVASGTIANLGSTTSPAPLTVGTLTDGGANYRTITFTDNVNTSQVRLTSFSGNFALTLQRTAGATAITAVDPVAQTLTINISTATAPTASQLITLINSDPVASTFMRASLFSGGLGTPGSAVSPAAGVYTDAATNYQSVLFDNGVTTSSVRVVTIDTNTPYQVTLTRNTGASAVTSVNAFARTITINLSTTTIPSAQTLLDLINNNAQASQFLLATLATGNAADLGSVTSPAASGLTTQATYARSLFSVSDNANPVNVTNIQVKATTPGTVGNFTLNISRPGGNTAATVTGVNVASRVINLAIGNQNNGGPTALAIVQAINNHVDARQIVTATIVGGNANGNGDGNDGTTANNVGAQTLVAGTGTPLPGVVTGLAFDDPVEPTNLYGVTSNGDFLRINQSTGLAFVLGSVPGVSFQGLSLGPQNAAGGIYQDLFFAVSTEGGLYAFNSSGVLQGVFAGGTTTVDTSDVGSIPGDTPIGLAFSPLDFNLWHPTTRRSNDAGHGVNTAPDGTRSPGNPTITYPASGIGADRTFTQQQGGASFHFGFEPFVAQTAANAGTQAYIPYNGINAQFGILDERLHRDLASNATLAGTYGFYGGAYGSLLSSPFSLAGSVAADRPTMYLNYFLETENHPGETNAAGQDPFRDSARIFVSIDGGTTWNLVATNNSALSVADPSQQPQAELPGFLSHLSDAGLNSSTQRAQSHQVVQELFDNTGVWRQVRVDLSQFANQPNVRLRFDFSTAGRTPNDPVNAAFGELSANNRANRAQNNFFEGFYIDDIIVGYAERGEMVTGAAPDPAITNLFAAGQRTRDNDPNQNPDILNGRYQLEVRRTDEYVNATNDPIVATTFNTNDRHINSVSQTALVSFEPSTPIPSTTPVTTTLAGVTIPAAAIAPWSIDTTNPFTGARSLRSGNVDPTLRPVSIYQATTASLGSASTSAGVIQFTYAVSSALDVHGLRFFIDGVAQSLVPPHIDDPGSDTTLATGELDYRTVTFPFGAGAHTFTWVYDFRNASPAAGANAAFLDQIVLLQGGTGLLADRNRERPQGMFIVESNFISDSGVRGINVQPGTAEAGGGVPHPGSVINFPQINSQRLVPGVVIQNNVVSGSSGIRFAGETDADPQRPVPFGRIVNNTLVGLNQSGVGIDVVGLASPTVMNNLLTNLGTAIVNGGTGTIIKTNFFQNNASNGAAGTSPTVQSGNPPLFVDAANRNFYLVAGSAALDSSQSVEQDRANFVTFKSELGIPESPIFAPTRDVFGQLRVDSGASAGGGGSAVFIDRGAVDRSDKEAPYAVLLNPIDNDAIGQDRDPNATVVYLTNPLLENFSILLGDGPGANSPFEGTGVDGLTVSSATNAAVASNAVQVSHNGRLLVQNVDYVLAYNALSGVLLLTPLSTLWEQTGVYTITLNNNQIRDLAGNRLRSNQADESTKFFVLMPDVRLDYGDAPDSFGTLLASNGARHTLQPGATPRLGLRVDSEANGRPAPLTDDQAATLTVTPGSAFTVASPQPNVRSIQVLTATPVAGAASTISITIGAQTATFELVPAGFAPQRGNLAVPLLAGDTPALIAARLASAINTELIEEGAGATVVIDTASSDTILMTTFDDEDGVGVGTFDGPTDYIVFTYQGAPSPTTDFRDVLGFLNPLDEFGTTISVSASSAGLLDAWIDFDGNGAFGVDEKIFASRPLVVGDNRLRIVTPLNTVDGTRWARFRISEGGGLGPTELAIGGEVEDYLVEIINVPPTIPVNDNFVVNEDAVLDTTNVVSFPGTVFSNDPVTGFLPPQFIINSQPTNGTLVVTDPYSGRFIYTPRQDYYGSDSFTYWVSTQPLPGSVLPPNVQLATVNINVVPVNDDPLAVNNRVFPALEDTPVTITAANLLAGAVGHNSPAYPSTASPTFPWNESNQNTTLRVISINIGGIDYTATTAGIATSRGTFDLTFAAGALTSLVFTPTQDLNRDNLRNPISDPIIRQSFTFTIEDDGISRLPVSDVPVMGDRRTHTATAHINVAPTNDTPTPSADVVTIGPIGTTAPVTNSWSQYFTLRSLPVPVPTEDTTLVIPRQFLLQNDLAGSPTAHDENIAGSINDAPLRIVGVSINNRNATVSLDGSGNVVLVPPTDVYGNVTFTYEVEDSGINENLAGVRTVAPLRATGTVTVTLQPVNDVPVTYNRALTFTESADAGVDNPPHPFTAADLLNGTVAELDSVPGLFAADLPAPFNETEQLATLRVFGFTTAAGSVDSASLSGSGGTGMLTLASDQGGRYEFDFVNFAFVAGRFFPAADYNERTPFVATEGLRFMIEDSGLTTDPDLGGTVTLGRQRSTPATLTINVLPSNDAPIFTMPTGFSFAENAGTTVVQSNFITGIAPSELSARDELQRQNVSITFVPVNVPAGLMTSIPTVTVNGGAGAWPGTGTLNVFPAADAFGFAVYDVVATDLNDGASRTTTKRLTITIDPVNDVPVAYSRAYSVSEAVEVDGQTALISFNAAGLLNGTGAETPSVAGVFPGALISPYNETEQTLRVVRFEVPGATAVDGTINEPGLSGGNGTVTRTTLNGGTLTFNFSNGAFTSGSYAPAINYNERTPFNATDLFSYIISDNGRTTLPGSGFVNFGGSPTDSTITIPEQRSAAAVVTITVTPSNDPPVYNVALNPDGQPAFDILERDDLGTTVIPNAIINILPAPATALDELARQGVTFTVLTGLSTVPAGLMAADPVIANDGTLSISPAIDAVGTAVYVFDAIDNEPATAGFGSRSTRGTLTINVRPVNDAPRLASPAPVDARPSNADEAWVVDPATGTIRFTMKEDNTGPGGVTSAYVIDTRQVNSAAGRIGLLDPYSVGPVNEADSTLGGNQQLRVFSFDSTTARGGTIAVLATDANGNPTQFAYTPPTHYNSLQGPVDSFTYIIADNTLATGETWNLGTRGLTEDNLVRTGRVEFVLNPVNDQPAFVIGAPTRSVLEDVGAVTINAFASSISVGPAGAIDEPNSQSPVFTLMPVGSVAGLFAVPPAISSTGTLTFTTAADAVGVAVYDVTMIDGGLSNTARGDLNLAGPVRITINLRPVNDAPRVATPTLIDSRPTNPDEAWVVDPATGTIRFTMKEDNTGAGGTTSPYILHARSSDSAEGRIGLLDPYTVGPVNESDSTLGGSQTLRITTFPVGTDSLTTTLNGTITVEQRDANGFPIRFRYVPPVDFNSLIGDIDSFVYTIEDDAAGLGETWNLGSNGLVEDRLTRTVRVEFRLNPVNDIPLFNIPAPVFTTLEDAGPVIVPAFAEGIAPAAPTAGDELTGQMLRFDLQPTTPENGLFLVSPAIGADGVLTFTPAADAVGSISYVVNLFDDGADNVGRGDLFRRGPVTITIHVRPLNDQPRLNTSVIGTSSATGNPDEAWSVSNAGVITFTLPEDNTGAGGATSPFIIDSRRVNSAADRIGLLDVFNVGPANEADGTLGGSQQLRVLNFPGNASSVTTTRGGTVRIAARDANNFATRFEYIPPTNYNSLQGARDSFTYIIEDDATNLGESWNIGANGLVESRVTRTGRVEFVLNPVNDRPEFSISNASHTVSEDAGSILVPGFATNISAGPATAADERGSQSVEFTLEPQTAVNGLFSVAPAIGVNGTLSYTPAPNAFGTVVYAVTLVDTGISSEPRGDLNSQGPVLITINVRAVNDAPALNPAVINTSQVTNANEAWSVDAQGVITYTLAEDNTQAAGQPAPLYIIDIARTNPAADRIGLLDPFTVGAANEATVIDGGSQILRLIDVPAATELGGTLTVLESVGGFVTRLGYRPAANYNSAQGPVDSFLYTFEDDSPGGETFDPVTGQLIDGRLTRTNRVRFVLNPLNDSPDFLGAADVTVAEDSTAGPAVGQSVITNFVTSVVAGPVGADDELLGANRQSVTFRVDPVSGNPAGLFSVAPSVSADGTLTFTTAADANGVASFTLVGIDNGTGSDTDPLQSNTSTVRTFSITVTRVNDSPSFTAGADVVVDEDSGPYSVVAPYATNIVPGPANEANDGQTVTFQVNIPAASASLFAVAPAISPNGFLTFTPATDAVGTVVATVIATDSLGGTSQPVPLTITILEVNDPPVANDFAVSGDEDNAIVVTQSQFLQIASDPDLATNPAEVLTITDLLTPTSLGALVTVNSNGDIVYDPRGSAVLQALRAGDTVVDRFTYRLQDTAGVPSDLATVQVTITGLNDRPTTVNDSAVIVTATSTILRPLLNDDDVDNDVDPNRGGRLNPGSLIITDQPDNGSLTVQPDGTLIYTSRSGFRGTDSISYTVADDLGQQSAQATILLNVAPNPTISNISTGSFVGDPTAISLAPFDVPTGTLDFTSVIIVDDPDFGTVTVQPNGTIIYEPNDGFVGTDSFRFTIEDQQGRQSNPVTVTVQNVNSRLQNPRSFRDVNASGSVTALDALLIVNHLSRSVRQGGGSSIPVLDSDRGPNFYDVNGDGRITSLDALLVINQIARDNRLRNSGGDAELGSGLIDVNLLSAPEIGFSSMVATGTVVEPVYSNMVSAEESALDAGSFETTNVSLADLELLAWDLMDDESEEEDLFASTIDAALDQWEDE